MDYNKNCKIIKNMSALLFWFYVITINLVLVINIIKGDYLKGIGLAIGLGLLYVVNVLLLAGLHKYFKNRY